MEAILKEAVADEVPPETAVEPEEDPERLPPPWRPLGRSRPWCYHIFRIIFVQPFKLGFPVVLIYDFLMK